MSSGNFLPKKNNLENVRFGKLVAINSVGKNKRGNLYRWLCKCDCGKEIIVDSSSLLQGKRTHCGCENKSPTHSVLYDLTNQTFGRLYVESLIKKNINGKTRSFWHCRCECGNYKDVTGADLRGGRVSSCGCLWKENSLLRGKESYKDGRSKERLYKIYRGMKTRCTNPNRDDWKDYGGRGITVCDEWEIYENFKSWALNNGYSDDLTIDRIDVNKGYCPENCRWVTLKEQARNKRNTVKLTINGIEKSLADWCEEEDKNYSIVLRRKEDGWDDYDCLYGKGNI